MPDKPAAMHGSMHDRTPCPIIEGLMGVRLMVEDAEHPAIDAAIREIAALRAQLRRAHHWDEYHPAYIAGSRAAAYRRAHPDSDRESDRQNGR